MIEESSMRQVCDALHRAIQERDNLRRELAEARAENQQLASLLESAKCVNENECFLRSREAGEAEKRLDAARAEAGRLREGIEKLGGLGSWFEFVLGTKVEHRGYADPSGHPHGGGVVVIPEWEARRHLDEIRAALAAPAADASGEVRP